MADLHDAGLILCGGAAENVESNIKPLVYFSMNGMILIADFQARDSVLSCLHKHHAHIDGDKLPG